MHRPNLLALAIVEAASLASAKPMPPQASGLHAADTDRFPASRHAALARGVSLLSWFWHARDASPGAISKYTSEADAVAMKNGDLAHVRLPLDPLTLGLAESKQIDPAAGNAARLLGALAMLNKAGLKLIVDAHPLGKKSVTILVDKDSKWTEN